MSGINLLPQELKLNKYAINASKSLRKVAILAIVILFVVSLGFAGVSILLNYQKKSLTDDQEVLKNNIMTFEQTEQKLVLMQNRLSGIQQVFSNNSAREEIEILQTIIEKNPQNINMDGAKIDLDKVIVNITAKNSSDLTSFYSLLENSGFKHISLDTFNYSIETGYKVGIAISK